MRRVAKGFDSIRLYAFAGLLCFACDRGPTSPLSGLAVTTSVVPSVFHVGEEVMVRVVVTNRGIEPRTISINACPDPFVVSTPDGTTVAPGQRICTAELILRTLAPGDQYTFAEQWAGDAIRGGFDAPAAVLAPGSYLVRGTMNGAGVDNPGVMIQITR